MLCSLSGQVPQEPVVSLKSGLVFEKRLLLQYLAQNQRRCPVTDEELDADADLLPLRSHAAGAAASSAGATPSGPPLEGASIPQLLGLFQSEWDAAMLETFALKKHLAQTRQELSHALYQHDAACRVIARLNAENAALREKLAARAGPQTDEEDVDMAADGAALAPEVVATVEAKQKELAKRRKDFKKREAPRRAEWLAGLADWSLKSTHTLHDADKPGVLAVAVDAKRPERLATAGVDKHVKVFNSQRQQLEATLAGHAKKVAAVEFHPTADLIVTGAHDKTLKLWTRAEDEDAYRVGATLDGYDDAVSALSIHPTGNYVLGGALDATWGFHDVRAGKLLARYALSGEVAVAASAKSVNETRGVRFHPDGGIFGTAAKSKLVQMWAVNTLANVVTFEGHAAPVNALAFSENGYHLASGADDGVVKLWDLRKAASFCELDLSGADTKKKAAVRALQFDPSGTFLAVGAGASVHVLHEQSKNNWAVVQTFDAHKAAVTGVAFAADGSYLASASMDRSLKLFR